MPDLINKYRIESIKIKIENLDSNHQYNIYDILSKYNMKYTQNNNGLFFDITYIDEKCLLEIEDFLNIVENRIDLDSEREKEINQLKSKMNKKIN
jgi:hypothetical protein